MNDKMISKLIETKILFFEKCMNNINYYICACGDICTNLSIKIHLFSKRHINMFDKLYLRKHRVSHRKEKCTICLDDQNYFWTCDECSNIHCLQCHLDILAIECPFCQTSYYEEKVKDKVLSFE